MYKMDQNQGNSLSMEMQKIWMKKRWIINPGFFVKTKCHDTYQKKSLKKREKMEKKDIKMYTLSIDGIE